MTESDFQSLLRAGIAAAKAVQAAQGQAAAAERQQAAELLIQVLERDPGAISAWLWLSTVVDDVADKRACLERVLAIDPGNKFAQTGLARLAQLAPATPVHLKPLPSRQKPAPLPANQAPCPFCGQPIPRMAGACPHCGCALLVTCPACGERVDVEEAACPACGQALGDFRQGPAYWAGLAAAYQAGQQLQPALEAWRSVEALQPDYPHLYLHLGQIQAQVDRTETAIATLQRALEQAEDRPVVAATLGQIYQQLHRWQEAETLYGQILADSPSAEMHYALGWLLMEQGRAKEAFPHLRQATRLDPQLGLAWLRLAQLFEAARDSRQATQAYRRAAALLPADTLEAQRVQNRLEQLRPALPVALAGSGAELVRQMMGPVLLVVLAALLDAGLRPWWIPWTGWLALFLATGSAFLVISATSLPHNPLICRLAGQTGLDDGLRLPLALAGGLGWLLAFGLILLPLGQALPEVPPCPC